MDADGDGKVSKLEYLEYMLVAMRLVDEPTLKLIHEQFQSLDVDDSGSLNKRDLEILAKHRHKELRTKLALASYKYRLTHTRTSPSEKIAASGVKKWLIS